MPCHSDQTTSDDAQSRTHVETDLSSGNLKHPAQRSATGAIAGSDPPKPPVAPRGGETTMIEPLAVSITEAARLLGIGRTHLYAQLQKKTLVAHKIGKRTVISMASIKALLNAS